MSSTFKSIGLTIALRLSCIDRNLPRYDLVRKLYRSRFLSMHEIRRRQYSTSISLCNISVGPIDVNIKPVSDTVKPKIRIQDVLAVKAQKEYTLSHKATVGDAISFLTDQNLSSSVVVDDDGNLSGIFTARDILRFVHKFGGNSNRNQAKALEESITNIMAKKEKVVYCSPTDSVKRCREIMFLLKIRNLPVVDDGKIVGIVTMKDLADSSFSLSDAGGKKGFIHNVTGRKGIPEGTKVSEDSWGSKIPRKPNIRVNFGSFALPHPYKSQSNVSSSRRDYGARELCDDMSLSEDAHFAIRIGGLTPESASQVYFCVADGVGSWRQYGVDPREFSHRLVKNAERALLADAQQRASLHDSGFSGSGLTVADNDAIHPLDVVLEAWNITLGDRVIGSSTICVATIDKKLNQLSYCNIGDCGLMVVRHIDSETAGYMRERQQPRHLRNTDLKIAFLSQQQLRSFNLPYQLGYSGDIQDFKGAFETPNDADTASIALLPGDVIILATDGLYDNLDLQEIVEEVNKWEKVWFPSVDGSEIQRYSMKGDEASESLAKQLVLKAREYSLDKNRDSPFALLAKENDIMWGGGMPDDTTVIVARVHIAA